MLRSKPDEVLEALDSLLVVLREASQRNQVAARRARTIRRLRSHGRPYGEILRRVEGALNLGITAENVGSLLEANRRLQGAEIRALFGEGLGAGEIATLLGMTEKRAREIVANISGQDGVTA